MKCFIKDDGFAGCKFKTEEGWSADTIGEFRGWHQVEKEAPAGQPTLGTTLYCIVVKSPNPRVDEGGLVAQMQQNGWSVFGCDANKVMNGGAAPRAKEATAGGWNSVANTDIFVTIWDQIIAEGQWKNFDWTVKVDPDAVFFPDRLRQHLGKLRAPAGSAVYIKNCDFKFGFMGSLEIFSMKATELFSLNGAQCKNKIGHEGGEDFYMMTCMDALGVKTMKDASILNDKYTSTATLNLGDVSPCSNGWTASFHPYRSAGVWMNCHNAASGAR
jgi:hypothetical protein